MKLSPGTTEDAQMARRLLRCLDGFIDKDAMTPYVSTACQPTRNLCDNGAALSASRTSFMAVVGILQVSSERATPLFESCAAAFAMVLRLLLSDVPGFAPPIVV